MYSQDDLINTKQSTYSRFLASELVFSVKSNSCFVYMIAMVSLVGFSLFLNVTKFLKITFRRSVFQKICKYSRIADLERARFIVNV